MPKASASRRSRGIPGFARKRPAAPAAALILILAASCAGTRTGAPPHTGAPSASPSASPARAVPNRPDAALPPEALSFLAELRDHVRRGDWTWAAGRADASFLRAMEGRPKDPYFYTYLFAAGTLANEDAEGAQRFEVLPLAKIRDMVWDEARMEGPVAVVKGRFILSQGSPIPFALRVLWRLASPALLGVQP